MRPNSRLLTNKSLITILALINLVAGGLYLCLLITGQTIPIFLQWVILSTLVPLVYSVKQYVQSKELR